MVCSFAVMWPDDDDDDGLELERETRLRESDQTSDRPTTVREEEGKAVDDEPPAKEDRGRGDD
jgi:hypothetical protein